MIKKVDKTKVTGSEVFTYTILATYSQVSQTNETETATKTETETETATTVTITEFFPSNLVYELPTIEGYLQKIIETEEKGGTLVTFDFGELESGTTVTFEIPVYFGEGRKDGDTFTNVATLYENGVESATASADTVTLTLISDFVLTKGRVTQEPVSSGDEVYFRLVLENKGDGGATISDVVLTDALPTGLVADLKYSVIGYDDSTTFPDKSADGQLGTWKGSTMIFDLSSYSGTKYVVDVHTQVDLRVASGTILTNTADWTVDNVEQTSSSVEVTVGSATPTDKLYQAISDIVESIALEEAGIYAILDAEGAKIQKAVSLGLCDENLLAVNGSVDSMVSSLTDLEQVLQAKLSLVLEATTTT